MVQYKGNGIYRIEVGNISGIFSEQDLSDAFTELSGIKEIILEVNEKVLGDAEDEAYQKGYDDGYDEGCESKED